MEKPTLIIEQVDGEGVVIDKTPIILVKEDSTKTAKLFIETNSGVVGCLRLQYDTDGSVKDIDLEKYK